LFLAGKQQVLTLQLPGGGQGQGQGQIMPAGIFFDNVESVFTEKIILQH
jgi:hypothetical protein